MFKNTSALIGVATAFILSVLFFGYLQFMPTTYVCIQNTTLKNGQEYNSVSYVKDHTLWFSYNDSNNNRSYSSGLLKSVSDKNYGNGSVNHTELGMFGKKEQNGKPVFYHNDYVYHAETVLHRCDKK